MYFAKFPQIYYGFPNTDSSDFDLQILTDITANVRFRKQVLESVTLYEEYDIREGETIEIIAERVYGNPEYHWIIMLLNERYDYLNDFPLSELELDNYITDVYGTDRYLVHHYELNGIQVEANATLKLKTTIDTSFIETVLPGDVIVGQTTTARGVVLSKSIEENTIAVQLDSVPFIENEGLALYGSRFNADIDVYEYGLLDGTYLASTNACVYTTTYDIITNELYEISVNESKRRIKLISPELLAQVINEFDGLI